MAVAELALDKKVEPLARDTKLRVRPRSALGLKYIEIQPGTSKDSYESGDTIPRQAGVRAARVRGPLLDVRREDAAAHAERDRRLRRRLRRTRPVHQPRDRGAQPALPRAHAGHDEPVRPGHGARPVLPPDRARLGTGRAGRAHAGAPVHGHGRHVRGDLGQPACPSEHDREGGAHDGRLDRLVPRPAALLHELHGPQPPPAPRGRGAAALAAGDQQRLQGGHPGPAAHRGAEREPRGRAERGQGPVREPQHAAGAPRPRHRADRQPPGDPVHRPVPDRLQLLHVLRAPAGRGAVGRPVGPDRRRHLAEPEHEGGELAPAEQLRQLDRLAAVGHPRGPEAAGREGQDGQPAVPALRAALPAGDRRPGQRRLPARPERLPERRAQQRPATARGTSTDGSEEHGLPIPDEFGTGSNGAIVPDDNNIPGLSGGTYKSRELGIDNLADVP